MRDVVGGNGKLATEPAIQLRGAECDVRAAAATRDGCGAALRMRAQ